MELEEARSLYERVVREQREVNLVINRERERLEGLVQIAMGLLKAFPELRRIDDRGEESVELERPRGSEAVRILLEEQPTGAFEVSAIVAALRERGWLPESANPGNAVRAALERLVINEPEDFGKVRVTDGGPIAYFSRKGEWGDHFMLPEDVDEEETEAT